jgi:hypothetical protein
VYFQRLGLGVLKVPEDAKFPLDKMISGRKALTNHLQSDLEIGPGYELLDWYNTGEWDGADFPNNFEDDLRELVLEQVRPRHHSPEFEEQPTPGLDRHR